MLVEDAIKIILKHRKMKKTVLAKKLGCTYQNLARMFMLKSMRISTILKILNLINCDLIIRDKTDQCEFVITIEDTFKRDEDEEVLCESVNEGSEP